ncbi:TPA: type 1 fimbrial protein [Klebsiella pneumoniae]|uniref:fimbrial protein n=1 Tax=Klebsiella pneumoniae TaxID=573 RepID=UPI00190DD38A|nr:fimbrial protein [Klebsiella pneumoniae]HBQ3374670.1 type 1 fimbrial protein [Klebsiella pneumoniae]HCL5397223.1 type 1 fimbrial protein [Klebsiella pneumoniae]
MKKTIVAVMVAASAVLSAQAMATNTAQVTVLGEVSDAANSCVVTPTGTLNSGIVQLITVTTAEANAESAGTLFKTQDFGFDVKDCAQGSATPVTGVTVNVSGITSSDNTILDNTASNGAIGIGIQRISDSHRVAFDGSDTMTESYSAASGTQLKYTTGYVRTNAATPVTEGPVKGVATFTIDYTL